MNLKESEIQLFNLALAVQQSFDDIYLGGGTAIMLKHHHRLSVDIDFFCPKQYHPEELTATLEKSFTIEQRNIFPANVDFLIEQIRVSFVYFPSVNIKPLEQLEELRIASDYDLFLNKILVAGKRIDIKDIFDAAFLYRKYQWDNHIIKKDFEKKFIYENYEFCIGALLSFNEYAKTGKVGKWISETLISLNRI
ncbi:nucleotidyl transferase AbiEii/AbiGii toxin family protein [Candidatus Amoebophilus asiaticus]|nr:nucleotidyl transferase AbiEii/AbiGii toxin family protein [Candidatus Amoebophilus asiaticus]